MSSWSETLSYYTHQRAQHHPNGTADPPVYSRDFAYAPGSVVRMARKTDSIGTASAKHFAELLSGPTVHIFVGKERRRWTLHVNLLCHHSSYFESEFRGHEVPKSRKTSDDRLDLPDDDPVGFELLVKWLYQGQLEDVSDTSEAEKYDYAVSCHKLYLLCDKFDMLMLKNVAIDQYRKGLFEAQLVPDAEEIDEIYRKSPPGSPFRVLMTKIAARQIMDPGLDKNAESYRVCFDNNADFAVDMVNAIRGMSGGNLFDDPTAGDECAYHDHSDGPNCHVKGNAKGPRSLVTSSQKRTPGKTGSSGVNGAVTQLNGTVGKPVSDSQSKRRSPKKLKAVNDTSGKPIAMVNGVSDISSKAAAQHGVQNDINRLNGINGQPRPAATRVQSSSTNGIAKSETSSINGTASSRSGSVQLAAGVSAAESGRKPPAKLRRGSPPQA